MLEPWINVADETRSRGPSTIGSRLRKCFEAIASGFEWLAGAITLLVGLSILAALPIAQFLSLGYLLEASGRVARTGRIRDGAIGVRLASRVGGIVAGCWLSLLPSRLVSSLATSAELIDPDGPLARSWRAILVVVVVLSLSHVVAACARGGRLRHFAWPPGSLIWLAKRLRLGHGGLYVESRDAAWTFVERLRLPHYFRLGLLGYIGSMAWLAVPVTMLSVGSRRPLVGLIGGVGAGDRGDDLTVLAGPVRSRRAVRLAVRDPNGSRAVPPGSLGVRDGVRDDGDRGDPALPCSRLRCCRGKRRGFPAFCSWPSCSRPGSPAAGPTREAGSARTVDTGSGEGWGGSRWSRSWRFMS